MTSVVQFESSHNPGNASLLPFQRLMTIVVLRMLLRYFIAVIQEHPRSLKVTSASFNTRSRRSKSNCCSPVEEGQLRSTIVITRNLP